MQASGVSLRWTGLIGKPEASRIFFAHYLMTKDFSERYANSANLLFYLQ
jgi:hypothetical protein